MQTHLPIKERKHMIGQTLMMSSSLKRIFLALAVAAVMAALMVASAAPAFAAPNTTNTCFSEVSGDPVAVGLSNDQAKQFENNTLNTFCVPTGQEQLVEEFLTGRREIIKDVPPGQQRQLERELAEQVAPGEERVAVEEGIAEQRVAGEERLAAETI
jgi:hypothetical protein